MEWVPRRRNLVNCRFRRSDPRPTSPSQFVASNRVVDRIGVRLRTRLRRIGNFEVQLPVAGLVPAERKAQIVEASITLNHTTVLNIIFLVIAGLLVARFFKTGGPEMMRMM